MIPLWHASKEFSSELEAAKRLEGMLETKRHRERQVVISVWQQFPGDPPRGTTDKFALNSPKSETKPRARAISTAFPFSGFS